MNLKRLVRPSVQNLMPYASARDEFMGEVSVYLDANENPYGKYNRYPDPYQKKLKIAISEIKNIATDNIFLSNGSDGIIDLLIRGFCEPKSDNIIITPPTFGMFRVAANINEVATKKVPLNKDFSLDANAVIDSVDEQTKIIFLCSPNNPTGNEIKSNKIFNILNAVNCLVVVDEAYKDFSSSPSWSSQIEKHPNLIVMQTFSKAWGLASIRLGMCYANQFVVEILNKIKLPYNINLLTQEVALEAISSGIIPNLEQINIEKQKLNTSLSDLDFVEKIFPSKANFFLVRFKNADLIYKYLCEKGIVVRNRSKELHCENCLRITVGTPEENQFLINALKDFTK